MRNCNQWKITYPDGVEDKTLCPEDNNEYFYVNEAENALVFFAPVRTSNGTTPNSSYIRSELRERTEDGSSDIYWTTTGRHMLYVEQAITHLPLVKSHLVATQIHGNKDDGIDDSMVLRLEENHLFLSFNGGKLRSDVTVKTDYALGTKHEVIFEVIDGKHYCYYSEDGNLLSAYNAGNASAYLVKADGSEVLMDLDYDQTYFKVGNYTQSNTEKEGDSTDDPDNYGEVLVYDFLVEHGESAPISVTGVKLSPSSSTIKAEATTSLTSAVSPSDATNKGVNYTSSDSSVATVSSSGLVTGLSEGSATITVKTDDGSFTSTATITVEAAAEPTAVNGVSLEVSNNSIYAENTTLLSATISPLNAANKSVSFTSSSNSIATVDANGLVTGVGEGTAIITVTTIDGGFTDTLSIEVLELPIGISNIALNKTITASIDPELDNPKENLLDGDTSTRLSSPGFPQVITIDLGETYDINYSELVFYKDRAYQYTISSTTEIDGPYTQVIDRSSNTTAGKIANPVVDYFTTSAQFIQIEFTGAAEYTGEWVSLVEFSIFGVLGEDEVTPFEQSSKGGLVNTYQLSDGVFNYNFEKIDHLHSIDIYTLTGKLSKTISLHNASGQIDLNQLESGMHYFIVNASTSIRGSFFKK